MNQEIITEELIKLLDRIYYGLFLLDSNWEFVYLNKEAAKLFPMKREQMYGKSLWQIWPKAKGTIVEENYRKAVETQRHRSFELQNQLGKRYKIDCYPFKKGLFVFFKDITQEQDFMQKQQDFISVASHELKTPLTTIGMYSQLLKKYVSKDHDQKALNIISSLTSQVDKLSTLVNYLLDITIIEARKMKLKKEKISINLLLADIVSDLQPMAQTQKLIVQNNVKKKIFADKLRISQVMFNLINNAIKYSPGTKKIIINASEQKDGITISIQDFGIGIGKIKREKLFAKLYRTTRGKKVAEGHGLGLFISSNIVKAHGGKIWVESEKGKGCIFYFTIPFDNKENRK